MESDLKNPASLVDRRMAVKKEVTVWDLEQIKSFLKHADGTGRYSIAYFIALTTGMRKGEILGLRWKNVDFEQHCVRITQTVSNDGKEILPYTKTKSGARAIDLPEETIKQLKKHYLLISREKTEAGRTTATMISSFAMSRACQPTVAIYEGLSSTLLRKQEILASVSMICVTRTRLCSCYKE